MRLYTFYSPTIKENIVLKDLVLLYSPFKLKYFNVYIGSPLIKSFNFDLFVTKEAFAIKDKRVIVCNYEDPKVLRDCLDLANTLPSTSFVLDYNLQSLWLHDSQEKVPNKTLSFVDLNYPFLELEKQAEELKATDKSFVNDFLEEMKQEDSNFELILRKLKASKRV